MHSFYLRFIFTSILFVALLSISQAQNNALDFDGSNDIVVTNTVTHGSNFTYEAWVKLNDASPNWSGIITNFNNDLIGFNY